MLTLVEKILFAIAVLVSLYFTYRGVMRIIGHIASGQGKPDWSVIGKRLSMKLVHLHITYRRTLKNIRRALPLWI